MFRHVRLKMGYLRCRLSLVLSSREQLVVVHENMRMPGSSTGDIQEARHFLPNSNLRRLALFLEKIVLIERDQRFRRTRNLDQAWVTRARRHDSATQKRQDDSLPLGAFCFLRGDELDALIIRDA